MNQLVFFNDYYDRRASSGKEYYMNPTSSNPIAKSHSLDYLSDKSFQCRHPSVGYLEFAKTPNFRSRRDAVFEPIELGRVSVTTSTIVQNQMKRKAVAMDGMEMGDGPKKLKHG